MVVAISENAFWCLTVPEDQKNAIISPAIRWVTLHERTTPRYNTNLDLRPSLPEEGHGVNQEHCAFAAKHDADCCTTFRRGVQGELPSNCLLLLCKTGPFYE
jgi:hypothetical protein